MEEKLYPDVPSGIESSGGARGGYARAPVTMQPGAVFGPNSQTLTCPYCHQEVTTVVKPEASTKTHIIAVLLCLVWCCCIPYCVDSCKNKNHYCPSCNAFLGAYVN